MRPVAILSIAVEVNGIIIITTTTIIIIIVVVVIIINNTTTAAAAVITCDELGHQQSSLPLHSDSVPSR